ncbi:MAG: hypothetical protein AABY33_10865 [Pseudomonadota bacterium]
MRKIFFQFALLSLPLLLSILPAYSQENSEQTNNSKNELYHDIEQDIYFDESAVCNFLTDYIKVEPHITKKEWQDILDGKYMDKQNVYHIGTPPAPDTDTQLLFVMYIYEHDGIKIGYSKYENKFDKIWSIVFSPYRLSEPLRDVSYYINNLKINNFANRSHLNLECDGIVMDGDFKGNALTQISFAISLSTI